MLSFFKRNKFPPKSIRVNRMEEYHTHYLGKYEDGKMFWGDPAFITKSNGERIDYAVLYLFDKLGHLENYKHHKFVNPENPENIWHKIDEYVKELDDVELCDIKIELFSVEIDGFNFGLRADDENKMIHLDPQSSISFEKPWNGEYYT